MLRFVMLAALLGTPATLSGCSSSTSAAQTKAVPAPSEAPEPAQTEKINPLIEAVLDADLEQVKALITAGADINAADEHGFRVLVNAMANYNVGIVDYLIRNGAETGLEKPKNSGEKKPLFGEGLGQNEMLLAAAEAGDLQSVKRLLAGGANINAQDEGGFTVLVTAIAGYHTELVKYLVNEGATIVANTQ